ncbi:MAG: type VII secretion protein EccCa, partial [Microbacterium sp.]
MSRGLVHRPTRTTVPVERPAPEEIAPPPTLTDDSNGTPMQFLLPVIGAMTSVIMMVVLRNGQPLFLVVAAVIFIVAIVGGLAFALSSRGRAIRQARFQRTMYLDYLERLQGELRERGESARKSALELDPPPEALLGIVRDPARLWERRRSDADFLSARVGSARRQWFDLSVAPAGTPIEPADPFMQSEAELVADHRGTVSDMPLAASLRDAATVAIIGRREETLGMARAILSQVAAAHTPDDVQIAAVYGERRASDWRGLDLLPHVHDLGLFDGPVPARRIARDVAGLGGVIGAELADRTQAASAARRRGSDLADLSRLVVVLDEHGGNASSVPLPDASMSQRDLGIVQIHLLDDRLQEPADVDLRIEVDRESAVLTTSASRPTARSERFDADRMGEREFHALARALAALRTARAVQAEAEDTSSFDVTDLLGIEHVDDIVPERLWAPRSPNRFLRVPFALDDAGQPVHLDLKESAQQGMGPHGICVGATGSGKSEMLRTLILSLALGHSPEDLSLILVDYKGGAAFAPFQGLPHLAGLIDNLADDPQLTVRARASLQGEVVRRQQLLKDADSSPSITHYRELRAERPELPPMPHLFVVIDEFGELLTAEPDFIDLFLQIGRIGRSIGVHLLLSSQRIEGGKLRGLDTYLSYRLGLRTFSEAESQVVLDTKDAYRLPAVPGYGILKVDTSLYRRFRAGYVSGPVPVERRPVVVEDDRQPRVYELPPYNGITPAGEEQRQAAPTLTRPDVGRQLVDEAVDRLRAASEAVRPVWLPPLPERVALQRVLEKRQGQGELDVAIGLEDDPARQRQRPLVLDLTRGGGHAAIVGSPGSGRSTLLRTVGASLALTRTPREVAIYGMDLTGGGLRRLEEFPHVGGIATRGDRD